MKRIVLIMPYLGEWPEWMPVFVETCRWNPTIDWVLLGDGGEISELPPNVRLMLTTVAELSERISGRLGFKVPGTFLEPIFPF